MTTYFEDREKESFEKLRALVRLLEISGPVVFDVGANIGQSIELYRESFPECTIHSFEPNPEMFRILEKKWNSEETVFLYSLALNSSSGIFPFHVTNVPEASSLLHPDPKLMRLSADNKYGSKKIDVECVTLDQFCSDNKISAIDILKLDVQGAELEVLKGAENILSSEMIPLLYVEVNFAETYCNQMELKDLLSYCSRYGYQLWDISPFLYTRTGRLWYANTIFLSRNAMLASEKNFKKSV